MHALENPLNYYYISYGICSYWYTGDGVSDWRRFNGTHISQRTLSTSKSFTQLTVEHRLLPLVLHSTSYTYLCARKLKTRIETIMCNLQASHLPVDFMRFERFLIHFGMDVDVRLGMDERRPLIWIFDLDGIRLTRRTTSRPPHRRGKVIRSQCEKTRQREISCVWYRVLTVKAYACAIAAATYSCKEHIRVHAVAGLSIRMAYGLNAQLTICRDQQCWLIFKYTIERNGNKLPYRGLALI